jgi:hypothetical protein
MKVVDKKISGKRISAIVNAIVSTKGKRSYSNPLANGGRSMKWVGLYPTTEEMEKIMRVIHREFIGAKIYVHHVAAQAPSAFMGDGGGFRVRVSMAPPPKELLRKKP